MTDFRSEAGWRARFPGAKPLALILTAVLIVGACTTAATQAPATPAPAPSTTAAPTVAATPTQKPSFLVAFTSIGLSSLPFIAALDELRAAGYTIGYPEITQSELVTEGVSQGQFAMGSGAINAMFSAIEKGAKIKAVVDRNSNEWTVGGINAIVECGDLGGSRYAVHSPGSVSGAMMRQWMGENCPEVPWEPLIIEGSQNRLAALLAGQLDASPLELGDWIKLRGERPNDFHLIVDFAQSLPNLLTGSVYANTDWLAENEEAVSELTLELLKVHRRIADEPGYLLSLYDKYLPDETTDRATAIFVTDTYRELGLFPVNGGLTPTALEYTANFFGPGGTGSTSRLVTVDEVSDLRYLDAALAELGTR